MHDFFYFILFEFDIREVVNVVTVSFDCLKKITTNELRESQNSDELKIIHYYKHKAKV